MLYRDLREWLTQAERIGELKRVGAEVHWDLEMSTVVYLAASNETSPALLFENVPDQTAGASVLYNMLGSSLPRIALGLGLATDSSAAELIKATKKLLALPGVVPEQVPESQAPVNENVLSGDEIDLTMFPAPRMWPLDGGRYLGTGDLVITRDPDDGSLNAGTYREMLLGPREVGFYVSPGKDAAIHREKYWRQGRPCPVVAAYGIDPAMFMVGTHSFPRNVFELEVAGQLKQGPVRVFTSDLTGLPVPADAEIVLEGFAYPGEVKPEGPFGEFSGYYGRPEGDSPVIRVERVRYRNSPILTAALMSDYPACEQNVLFSVFRSARVWNDLDTLGIPGITGVYDHPAAAGGFGLVVVALEQARPGHVAQVLALAAQSPAAAYYTKWIVAVDDDVDPTDINQVIWAMTTRCDPARDIDILRNTWSSPLDPSKNPVAERLYGSKALIDACKEHRYLHDFSRRTKVDAGMYEKVKARWAEYGLEQESVTPRGLEEDGPTRA